MMATPMATAFPNLRMIATTLRENISASHNNWGAMLLDVAQRLGVSGTAAERTIPAVRNPQYRGPRRRR